MKTPDKLKFSAFLPNAVPERNLWLFSSPIYVKGEAEKEKIKLQEGEDII